MLSKEKVLELIKAMPAEFSLDELVERLIVLEKIEVGLRQVAESKTLSMVEARKIFSIKLGNS